MRVDDLLNLPTDLPVPTDDGVLYPVVPSDRDAVQVIAWLRATGPATGPAEG